jgi:predicted phosphoadenosine phosphosulfate sulfurtransferase
MLLQRKHGKLVHTEQTVEEAALDRIRTVYDRYDTVCVSFSGGKDSTVVLNLTLQVARERGRLPLEVFFFDEEAIPDLTIEYIERVRQNPEIKLLWYCVPIQERNACSRKEPFWNPWAPEDRHKWVRPLPEGAITDLPGLRRDMSVAEAAQQLIHNRKDHGNVCHILGIRAQESLRRRRIVSSKAVDNFLAAPMHGFLARAFPIYDWSSEDVWIAAARHGWDYNQTYDVFQRMGMTLLEQRVCPPYGEEPVAGLAKYHKCFPEMWEKMIHRVHGANTAARYAKTDLYAHGVKDPPPGMTWRQYLESSISYWEEPERGQVVDHLNDLIRRHNKRSRLKIDDVTPDPISGVSWKFLAKIALRGDFKNRIAQKVNLEAERALKHLGITEKEALLKYGRPAYLAEIGLRPAEEP